MSSQKIRLFIIALVLAMGLRAGAQGITELSWPPELNGAENGTVRIETGKFLEIPEAVAEAAKKDGSAPFVMAGTAPIVDLAYHRGLPKLLVAPPAPPQAKGAKKAKNDAPAVPKTLWSSWGDIALAADGRVYVGIGDHANDAGGQANCFIYEWNPATRELRKIMDVNEVAGRKGDEPAFSKVHAKVDEGPDGKIYFSATLNDGNKAKLQQFKWSDSLPGGQIYQYDPATGQAIVFDNLQPRRVTATSLLDRQRNIWWCNLEAGPDGALNALYAYDLQSRKAIYQSPDGAVTHNRNFAIARDGSVFFNGKDGLWKYDPKANDIAPTGSKIAGPGTMRASTRESSDGYIYGVSHRPNGQVFRIATADGKVEMLGPDFLTGDYTSVIELSPDEKYLYYLPGAHGTARAIGTPVVQYEIATGQRKVLAFLRPALEEQHDYVPGGTYGMKISADGSTLFVNLNGHLSDRVRHPGMKDSGGFGLTSFLAIHIPESER
jgi:sugar lactone lactonase YvrE